MNPSCAMLDARRKGMTDSIQYAEKNGKILVQSDVQGRTLQRTKLPISCSSHWQCASNQNSRYSFG